MIEGGVLQSEMQGDWTTIGAATRAPEIVEALIRQLPALGEHGRV